MTRPRLWLARSRQPQRNTADNRLARCPREGAPWQPLRATSLRVQPTGLLCVAIQSADRLAAHQSGRGAALLGNVVGVVQLTNKRGGGFTADDEARPVDLSLSICTCARMHARTHARPSSLVV